MIVSSALMIWKGLMVVTGSESPIVVVLRYSVCVCVCVCVCACVRACVCACMRACVLYLCMGECSCFKSVKRTKKAKSTLHYG